ncbi:1-acyl-sn-glycerol-3-phosphate acyltransferases [Klenkia soli]|uniref:1-acyl-sn-glycerol-3-phosphate acyltransferases n=1 Tax=Klenkia soli TaxID=1052260 RepID=A0A1H0GHD7_9ACTN|nr:lysophospholipid acyltransferase family protein [Klenkia soli]SDO06310.1 1-acyl-sn-glycerol-3-phosphate acyltransferases [Klenkia soli]
MRERLRAWRPATPPLPADLEASVVDTDPEWFGRELAIAARPPWWLWRFLLTTVSPAVSLFGRVVVTGSIPEHLRGGPLILAANHIGDYDTFTVAAALHRVGVVPRFLATGGIMKAPVAGPVLERAGGIRVDRGTDVAAHAMRVVLVALEHGGQVLVYPEGRVGLTADGWPERGRTGLARLALQTRVPVIPVSQWGAHEVLQYANDWGKLRTALSAAWRQPALRVHVGAPVPLDDLAPGRTGDANRARTRIMAAITRGLVPLRAGEPADRIAFVDPTRPVKAQAAFPGGRVPADVPGAGPPLPPAGTLRR